MVHSTPLSAHQAHIQEVVYCLIGDVRAWGVWGGPGGGGGQGSRLWVCEWGWGVAGGEGGRCRSGVRFVSLCRLHSGV